MSKKKKKNNKAKHAKPVPKVRKPKEPWCTCQRIHSKSQWIRWILIVLVMCTVYGFSLISSGKEQPYLWINLLLMLVIWAGLLFEIKFHTYVSIIISVLTPILSFWIFESFSHNVFSSEKGITWKIQILNILLYILIMVICAAITGSFAGGAILSVMLLMVIALINYYTVSFRSSPILPWDLLSMKTALSVTSQYTFKLPGKIWMSCLLFILLAIFGSASKIRMNGWKKRTAAGISTLVFMICFVMLLQTQWIGKTFKLDDTLFTPNVLYRKNGFMVAFTVNLQYLKIDKPAGYKSAAVEDAAEHYEAEAEAMLEADDTPVKPHVIVIMDEAFSDLRVVTDFTTNEDYMPFTHKLQQGLVENVVTGNLFVSVCGGNTANSEFEFLTGNTMAFLPPGSVAYQQYIHDVTPSMAWTMKNHFDYQTMAMHPYYASGWDRDEVYPWLGFDHLTFLEQMKKMPYFANGQGYLRKYISDQAVADLLIHQYENERAGGQPMFSFNVTMQNHGGYFESFDNFDQEIVTVSADSQSHYKPYLDMYLSLVKKTDEALEYLIQYLSEVNEPVVVVYFGDHQPGDYVLKPIYKFKDDASLEERQKRYIVPFVIWANYDIEEEQVDCISLNYLQTLVCEKAGIPLTGYQMFLSDLREKLPVITANVKIDSEGRYYDADEVTPYEAELEIYKSFQYNNLFDKKDLRSRLFGASGS